MPQSRSDQGRTRHRFVLGPLLGAGTFGEVYLARMTSLHGIEQDVAVKLLNSDVDPRSQPVSRMRDEGRLLAGLNHPAILQAMDFCFLEGRIGLVTEFVPGADLDDCIHGVDPIPPRAAMQVIGAVADALHAAWESRTVEGGRLELVHRDIKPANIRVTPHGSVKLLDFGIAKSEDLQRETATQQRVAFGTPAYMAPEVLSYEVLKALPSRDVFALGCTLYECFVRERWFEGLDHQTIGRVSNRAERFREWRTSRLLKLGDLDAHVIDLLSRMLEYDHKLRPTAREVAETCIEVAEGMTGPSLWSWARQRRWPPVSDSSGPWTGRTLDDTAFGFDEGGKGPRVAGRAAALTDDRFLGSLEQAGREDRDALASGAIALPKPRARAQSEADTEDEPIARTTGVAATGTVMLGGVSPLALTVASLLIVLLAGGLLAVAAVLQFRPGLLPGDEPTLTAVDGGQRAAGRGKRGGGGGGGKDSGVLEAGGQGEGQAAEVWDAAKALVGKASVRLDTPHDVRIFRQGNAPIRIAPNSVVRVSPGPVEIRAKFGTRYVSQFHTTVSDGQTLAVRCDTERETCEGSR